MLLGIFIKNPDTRRDIMTLISQSGNGCVPIFTRREIKKTRVNGLIISTDVIGYFLVRTLKKKKIPYFIYRGVDIKPTKVYQQFYINALGEISPPFVAKEIVKVIRQIAISNRFAENDKK